MCERTPADTAFPTGRALTSIFRSIATAGSRRAEQIQSGTVAERSFSSLCGMRESTARCLRPPKYSQMAGLLRLKAYFSIALHLRVRQTRATRLLGLA